MLRYAKDSFSAAEALYQIREGKLYRKDYKTFEDYCKSVQDMSRQFANRLIKAGEVYGEMVPIVSKMELPMPDNEAQLRELSRVPENSERVEIYKKAHDLATKEETSLAARHIKQMIDSRKKNEEVKQVKPTRLSPRMRLERALPILKKLEPMVAKHDRAMETFAELKALIVGEE